MDAEWSIVIAAGSFFLAIVSTLVGVSWRLQGIISKKVEDSMDKHVESEHGKDSEGRTVRERVGLTEQAIKTLFKWKDRSNGRSSP